MTHRHISVPALPFLQLRSCTTQLQLLPTTDSCTGSALNALHPAMRSQMLCTSQLHDKEQSWELEYVYRGSCRDVLCEVLQTNHHEGVVVKAEMIPEMDSLNRQEVAFFERFGCAGFPQVYGHIVRQWQGETTSFLVMQQAPWTVRTALEVTMVVAAPAAEELTYVGNMIGSVLARLVSDATIRRYAHTDAHVGHWGVLQTFGDWKRQHPQVSTPVPVVCLDASQIKASGLIQPGFPLSQIRQFVRSAAGVIRGGRGESVQRYARLLEGLLDKHFGRSSVRHSLADTSVEQFMEDLMVSWLAQLPIFEPPWSVQPPPASDLPLPAHMQLSCKQAWPVLWQHIQKACFESRADAHSSFRGSGRYAVSHSRRLSWNDRAASDDFPRVPQMARWVSDIVNQLVSVLYDVMNSRFIAQGINCSRVSSAKKFRNNCEIVPRLNQRFCQLCGSPGISSDEASWLHSQNITNWPSINAILHVVHDEVLMMCGKNPADGIAYPRARIARLALAPEEILRIAREVTMIWSVASSHLDHESLAWQAVRDVDMSYVGRPDTTA